MPRFIFLRIAWMEHYQGVKPDDIPIGAGTYVTENADGGEVYNFYPIRSKYFGYARIQKGRNLRLKRVGANVEDDCIEDVTVVFFARNPETGGQRIVGWYEHATLFREIQSFSSKQRHHQPWYLTKTDVSNAYLLAKDDRLFDVPEDGPGQSNAWYVEEYYNRKYLREVIKYISDPDHYIFRNPIRSGGWQSDAELKLKIELESMKEVAKHFENQNYVVRYKHKENLGWDLEASSGKQTLLLEVKGLSGEFSFVDFTPNEFENSKNNKKHYRICIVSNVLNHNKKLDIFFKEKTYWVNRNGEKLTEKIRQSARYFNANQ